MKLEKITLNIPMGAKMGPAQEPVYGYKEIIAETNGQGLAIHRLNGNSGPWTVVHINSGMRISILGAKTKKRAIENMLSALALDFDWNQSEEDTLAAVRTTPGIRDALISIGDA